MPLVSKIAMKLDWDAVQVMSLTLKLLEDVNAHSLFAKIEPIFEEQFEKWERPQNEL
jgi:hypothetical protein